MQVPAARLQRFARIVEGGGPGTDHPDGAALARGAREARERETQLTELIWSAEMPRDASLAALSRFRDEVAAALRQAQPNGTPTCPS